MRTTIDRRTGLTLSSPVLTASGTFGYGVEAAGKVSFSGLGAIVSKGTTLQARTGNAPLRMETTAAGMLNTIGLQNVGVDAVVRKMAPVWATWETPVLVNVSAETLEEYAEVAGRLDGVPGVAGIELNVSCPNVHGGGGMFGSDARSAAAAAAAARRATALPLIVKLTPAVADIAPIAAAVEEEGADAVSLINTLPGMAIDVARRRPALAPGSGGLSGPAVKPVALYQVFRVAQTVSIPIVGIGGILNAADAIEFILAGAAAIEIGTALLIDPQAWRPIGAGIDAWAQREGVRDLSDVIGAANPAFKGKAGEVHLAGW